MSYQEESKKITLLLGKVSWEENLGSYYIDMRPAEIHYTNNIYNGKLDENGVPMVAGIGGKLEYSPVNIAQYGFITHTKWENNRNEEELKTLLACIEKLEELKSSKDDYSVWWYHSNVPKYNLTDPWASAMAQGEIISLYLRVYQITNDNSLLKTALEAYNFLKIDVSNGGTRFIDDNGDPWLEEYPSAPHSFVLNGFVYTILGIIDLYRVTGDKEIEIEMNKYINTLKKNISKFDCGYWSYYDLLKKELVRYYYQKNVHAPQMEVMYLLTNETIFHDLSKKWSRSVNKLNFIFVQIMYRVLPRYKKYFK